LSPEFWRTPSATTLPAKASDTTHMQKKINSRPIILPNHKMTDLGRGGVEGPIPLITPPMLTLHFENMEIWIKGRRGGDNI
jgi:hypothetical protein